MTGAPQNLPELPLSRTTLDRQGWRRATPGLLDALLADPATQVVQVREDRLQAYGEPTRLRRHRPDELCAEPGDLPVYLGRGADGVEVVGLVRRGDPSAQAVADAGDEEGWRSLRSLALLLDDADLGVATALVAMAHWHRSHGWCARCGAPTDPRHSGWVRRCAQGHESFPATSPAVIMAVTDPDDRLMLARNASWPQGRMSVVAGFVEPGESLEAAVVREVAEEVGLTVTDVAYAGNQPWPFPGSLMLGFRARAAGTALAFRDEEIAEARWFTRAELRDEVRAGTVLSGGTPVSIAYHLIESWLGEPIADLQP